MKGIPEKGRDTESLARSSVSRRFFAECKGLSPDTTWPVCSPARGREWRVSTGRGTEQRKPGASIASAWNVEEGGELGASGASDTEGTGRPPGRVAGTREAVHTHPASRPAQTRWTPPRTGPCLLRRLWGSGVLKSAGRDVLSFWGARGGCRILGQRGTKASVLTGGNK